MADAAAAEKGDGATVRILTGDDLISFVDKKGSSAEGEAIVGLSGTWYVKPKVDGEKIKESLENNYVTENQERLSRLIFQKEYKLHVYNPNGDEDEDVAWEMEKAWEIKDVQLWASCQRIWKDMHGWGASLISPGWKRNGARMDIMELRSLPPESFINPPPNQKFTYNEILQGITKGESGVEYWQTGEDGKPKQLKNVLMLTDPTERGLGGKSKIISLVPVVNLINFCWQAQAQKVNRIGAPPLFLHFTSPPQIDKSIGRDDLAYMQKILTNWGRNTQWALYENMEPVSLQITDNQSAMQTIEKLEQRIRDYFSPATIIKREGSTIGGSTASEADLTIQYIEGQHRMMEILIDPLLQQWLDWNGYEGWTVKIEFPVPQPDRTQLNIQMALAGGQLKVLTIDELRVLLGHPELTDEQRAILEAEIKARAPPPSPFGGGFGAPGGDQGAGDQDGEDTTLEPGSGNPDDQAEVPAPPQRFSFAQLIAFPYPNEHAARMVSPDKFQEGKDSWGSDDIATGIRAIMGMLKGSGKWVVQAYRFDRRKFSAAQARAWLKRHNKHPILFEPATGQGDQQTHTEHRADADELRLREQLLRADQEALAGLARALEHERQQGGQ